MGGSCYCPNFQKNIIISANVEVNTPPNTLNKNSIQNKNDQSSLNKNKLSNIANKKGNAVSDIEVEKNNILFNDINNENSNENFISSENSKKDNNLLPPNYQNNNNLISSQINNEILCNNNTPLQIINASRGKTSLVNGVEKVESATPKMGKVKLEDKAKGKKKAFSHFCQNKI